MISNVALVLGVIVGPVLLGVLLYYAIKATEKRDNSPAAAREITERGTERLYNAENEDFARSEEASRIHKFQRRHAKNHN